MFAINIAQKNNQLELFTWASPENKEFQWNDVNKEQSI